MYIIIYWSNLLNIILNTYKLFDNLDNNSYIYEAFHRIIANIINENYYKSISINFIRHGSPLCHQYLKFKDIKPYQLDKNINQTLQKSSSSFNQTELNVLRRVNMIDNEYMYWNQMKRIYENTYVNFIECKRFLEQDIVNYFKQHCIIKILFINGDSINYTINDTYSSKNFNWIEDINLQVKDNIKTNIIELDKII